MQVTPTSSLWAQLCFPQEAAGHSDSEASVPTQPTSSSQMGPAPQPKRPAAGSGCRGPPQPSSRQTTAESLMSQPSSQTVPQRPSCHTSSRPEHLLGPATRRSWGDPASGPGSGGSVGEAGGRLPTGPGVWLTKVDRSRGAEVLLSTVGAVGCTSPSGMPSHTAPASSRW